MFGFVDTMAVIFYDVKVVVYVEEDVTVSTQWTGPDAPR